MKTIEEFLSYLCSVDVKLWIEENRLRCSAPKDVLTPVIKLELAERKEDILAFIRKNNVAVSSNNQPIYPVKRQENLPLSFAQQRLWFLAQLEPDSSFYNIPAAVRLEGQLNLEALQQSFNEIISRHEVLRTNFQTTQEQAVVVIYEQKPLTLSIVDISELAANQQQVEVKQQAAQAAQVAFDISSDHLLRVKLLRLDEQEHILLLTMHHIISDAWSIDVIVRELATLYQAFLSGQPLPLPELAIQYVDFAVWQRQWLQAQVLETQLSYWLKHLENAPKVLELPTDHPRPAIQTFRGRTYSFELSQELSASLNKLSQQQGSTLFMTLLAAFQTLLWRYTGIEDIVVGSPIANRNRTEIEGLIGFFVNTLVLRTNLAGNPSFEELLKRVREVALGAYAHQDLPFELLVEQLQPERSLSHTPLFQVMFVLQNAPMSVLELPGLTLSSVESESDTAKFDLTLQIEQTQSGLVGSLEYNSDLFEENTICRMAAHLQTLLQAIVANPQQRLSQLPLLTQAQRHQLLYEWNHTEVEYPQNQCIHQLFEAQVERTPDAVAVVFEGQQLTYRQLNTRANQLAHYLQHLGVKPEVLVGICLERSLDMVIGLLAILKAGGAYVPLDPAYPHERLAFILEDAAVSVLLTTALLVEIIPQHKAKVVCLDADWQTIAEHSKQNLFSELITDNLAYVIYTSGSTGRPKGVMIQHASTVAMLDWANKTFAIEARLGVLASTSICFDLSVFEVFVPLCYGGKVILIENALYLQTSPAAKSVTLINTVPSVISQLLRNDAIPASVQTVNVAGEPLHNKLVQQLYQQNNIQQVFNLYGPSEDTTYSTCAWIHKGASNTPPIGRPIHNTEIYLLDQNLQLVPVGVQGMLYIGGEGLARGYLNEAKLTADKFIPNPYANLPGKRLYKTGDLARYLPNGEIEYIGRIDNQVKIRGFRIELGEIEALISQYPAVREVVVVVREDSADSKNLVTYVVPQKEQTLVIPELRSFLESKLPNYMVPTAFIILEALPLTPNGKVDRKALPVPDITQVISSNIVPPSTPIENLLAGIWSEILSIDKVGINNNFFELGGHSLIATRVMSQIRQVFQVELPLRYLFEKPTIVGLAKEIEKATKVNSAVESTNIEPIERSQQLPLSFAQQRLWFLAQLEPDSSFYNIPAAVRLEGQLNLEALQQSFNEIISRHEVLRTNFQTTQGQAVVVIYEQKPLTLSIVDISELTANQQQVEVKQQAAQAAQVAFDISSDHLLRVKLLRLDEQEHILLLTMHHIISDAWSIDVIVRELATLYQAFLSGQPLPLPELAIQYVDFAVWQRQWLQAQVLETQLSYWLKHLENAPKVLELPTDHPRPAIQTFRGRTYSFELSQELSASLNKLSQQQGSTLFMTLLAAFQTLLWRYTGIEDIVVGSPIANRNRTEIEGLIGFFVNTLVLRTNLAGNPSFEELLKRVREVALGAYAHQDLPFELLVEQLQPERSLSHTPLFQVMFVLQNAPMSVLELPGLTLSSVESESDTAKFDLTLQIEQTQSGLVGSLEYNSDLFEENTICRMAAHLQTLLQAIVANPQQRLSQLPLLTQAQRHQLLYEWNHTEVEYPQNQCIHQLFEAQVERTPDAVAVVFEDQQLTYRQLNTRANQLAHYLQHLGVKPEVLVGICVERSLDMVVGLLAILKAGGAYVPLDPAYPHERLAFILEDAAVSVLLTQQLIENLPQHQTRVVCLDTDWEIVAQQSSQNPISEYTTNNLAYIIYTSGSTGQPKGVLVNHSNVVRLLAATESWYNFNQHDVWTLFHSIAFDFSVWEIWGALLYGGKLIVVPYWLTRSPQEFYQLLLTQQVTVLNQTPSAFRQLIQVEESLENINNLSLRKVIFGGEALQIESLRPWFERHGDQFPQLVNMYGITETTVHVTYRLLTMADLEVASASIIGRPIDDLQVYLLDRDGQPVPIGVTGEMYIGGAGVVRGYLNRPELTPVRFIPNPFSNKPNARLYKSGDLARYFPNGDIEYLGRIDNQVKVRGFRIELGEIEALITQHPAVRETVVVVREDSADSQQLVAYVVPQKEQTLIIPELRSFLESKLPNYMVPKAFVTLEVLPLTPNGKVDRKALPAPDGVITRKHEYVAPHTAIEQTLTNIWQELLLKEKVSIHDNFFEIGGDSILSIQVVSRAKNLGIQITTKQIFQNQTIAELARVANTTVCVSAQQGIVTGVAPLTPIQHWFFAQNLQDFYHFNQSVLLQLPKNIKIELLEKAVEKLLEHHDALRLRFRLQASESKQINSDKDNNVPFSIIDLSSTPKLLQSQALSKIATEFQASLNLSTGPIIKVVMFNLGSESDARLLIIIHHLAVDGVSWRILLSDLETIYQQLVGQQPIQLNAKTTAFIDWAEKLSNYAQLEIIKQELDYWLNQSWSKITPLPLDSARALQENTVDNAASVSVKLNVEETRILLGSVNEAYNTQINDILLSALILSLARWTGNSTVVINLEGHGREELFEDVDLSRTVGWFTSLFPVLLQLPDLDQPASVIKSIKEQLRAIPNRGIGYGILRYLCKDITVNQQLQTIPTPEISFNYLGQFDQVESQSDWKFAPESTGANQSFKQIRDHLLDINALVIEGELQIDWTYGSNVHTQATVENLAQSYIQAIRLIIEHCQSENAFGYTPSDFPDAQLNQLELDELLEIWHK
ncbi:amino acid adenylation domain-containing protein [Nostoc sp.]|uniref:amino acid adenylation domain-containing protein n=1 Tax=Nostoc sp. TaxID=1180 RepID=UPI002FFA2B04